MKGSPLWFIMLAPVFVIALLLVGAGYYIGTKVTAKDHYYVCQPELGYPGLGYCAEVDAHEVEVPHENE